MTDSAGTETGAIIGASLVIPGNDTEGLVKNYAQKSMDFFEDYSSELYVAQELNFWQNALVTLGFAALLSFSVFGCLRKKYYIDPIKIASLTEVEVIINTQLDLANKGELHSNDKQFVDQKIARLDELAGEWKKRQTADPLMLEIFVKARAAVQKIATDSQVLQNHIVEELEKLVEKIDHVQAKHTRYRVIRFGGACLTGVVAMFVAQITLIQLINYFL